MNPFHYSKPLDVQEAVHLAGPNTRFIAGGTNLLDLMKENITRPERLIDITGLPLRDVRETAAGGLMIGALVSNADLAWHPWWKRATRCCPRRSWPVPRHSCATWPVPEATCCNAPVVITSTTPACPATNASQAAVARPAKA